MKNLRSEFQSYSVMEPTAYPFDTSAAIQNLIAAYQVERKPLTVSFRNLVPWIKMGERATHHIHHYPAKLIPHIAHFFLATDRFCPRGGLVLDPFGGTGTVALEVVLSGRCAAYSDTNPLARMITEAKVNVLPGLKAEELIASLENRYKLARSKSAPNVVNISKWFDPSVIRALARLRRVIDLEPCDSLRRFLLITFSATLRKVSNADPRLSVPVLDKRRERDGKQIRVFHEFSQQLHSNVRRMGAFEVLMKSQALIKMAGLDSRRLVESEGGNLKCGEVDLVITSPPYAGAQKYVRASSLSLGWLGIAGKGELKPLEEQTIGREHLRQDDRNCEGTSKAPSAEAVIERIAKKNPVRAAICRVYLREMYEALMQSSLCLKDGGYFVLVIGNNQVCGEEFWSSTYLTEMLVDIGFEVELELVDEIKSRGLMTKRNRSAGMISREWVIVFRKVTDVGSAKRIV